jgi:predicted O-linked N-acetylglucosamine transferase (SPINDLY family)
VTSRRDEALALLHRGHEIHLAADLVGAASDYRRALALLPDLVDASHFLAVAQLQAGDVERAAVLLTTLLRRAPLAPIAVNLGLARLAAGQAEGAAIAFRQTAALEPREPTAWIELGNGLAHVGDFQAAAIHFGRAVSVDPTDGIALGNLGGALATRGLQSAGRWHRRAIAAAPTSVRAWVNAGHGSREARDWETACRAYDRAAALEPTNAIALSEGLHARLQLAEWSDLSRRTGHLAALLARGGAAPPFHLLALELPARLKRANSERWSTQYAARHVPRHVPAESGRLRLGYISGDFRRHAVAYEMIGLLEAHNRGNLDLYGYSWAGDDGSEVRARLAKVFGDIVDLGPLNDAVAAARIAADRIDVLIDLSGHTYGARPGILARRPAPAQVNYFGYPGVTGAAYHDYALVDSIVAPPGSEGDYREALVRLPGCYWPHDTGPSSAAAPDRARHGLPQDAVVLVCFNQIYKIQPVSFVVWMQVLRSVPDAVLWLLDPGPAARANLRKEAVRAGVAAERVIFAPPAVHAEHLARIAVADLAIDTLPYNAHTTASDALSIGCPMATWIGKDFAGRVCASMLVDLNLADLVAADASTYAELLIGLARDRDLLAALRERLGIRRSAGPLFDMNRLARAIEEAALEMRRRSRAGLPAEGFAIRSAAKS